MKRYGNLYPQICAKDNLYLAHLNARKGKSHYMEVQAVNADPEHYIDALHGMLVNKTYRTAEYQTKQIYEPKQRTIYKLPYYPDRIVHHAIMQVLQPIWDKQFIYDLYSAIPGKGLHAGSYRLRGFMKDVPNTRYCLKMDIAKYYPSVRHDVLIDQIKHTIKCPDTLWLLEEIIRSPGGETNIPIGNYLSQYFSNIYLSELDHLIKEKHQMKYYIRYCDDAVVLHSDKTVLKELLEELTERLAPMGLHLNKKTQIFPVDARGIDLLGYRHFRGYTLLRTSSARRLKHRLHSITTHPERYDAQTIISSVMSYWGWLQHCNSYNLQQSCLLTRDLQAVMRNAAATLGISNPLENYHDRKYHQATGHRNQHDQKRCC